METAIRQLLHDPVIGLPILCAILAVVALATGSLRALQSGTFEWPRFSAWSRDLSTVLIITLVFATSKMAGLFIPEGGLSVAGIDIAPILSVAGPGVFFTAGVAAAGTFIASKVAAIVNAVKTTPAP